MGVEFKIENEEEIELALKNANEDVEEAVQQVQKEYQEKVYQRLRRTSPVKTGKYKGSWEKNERSGIKYVKNNDPKAHYLVYPNQRMVGSDKADKPGPGIIHNVRGRVKQMRERYSNTMIQRVAEAVESNISFGSGK